MISINNGPQGVYVAGEGLEQRLFQVGNAVVLFDGIVYSRVLKSALPFANELDGLVSRIARDYSGGKVLVCGVKDNKAVVYSAGARAVEDVSHGYESKNVHLNLSLESLNDFVDFVEHSQSSQFGFVVNSGVSLLFSPAVKLSFPSALYSRKELCDFKNVAFSWFNRILQGHPADLKQYLQNLCCIDIDEVASSIQSGGGYEILASKEVFSRLLPGTGYFCDYEYLSDIAGKMAEDNLFLMKKQQELLSNDNTPVKGFARICFSQGNIILKLNSMLESLEQLLVKKKLVDKPVFNFDSVNASVRKSQKFYAKVGCISDQSL